MSTFEETVEYIDERLLANGKEITYQNRIAYAEVQFMHASGFGTIGEIAKWLEVLKKLQP